MENFEDGEPAWPNSVSLLAHIYREVFQKSDSQQSPLLFSVLKSCCEVSTSTYQKMRSIYLIAFFLKCLTKWFYGL